MLAHLGVQISLLPTALKSNYTVIDPGDNTRKLTSWNSWMEQHKFPVGNGTYFGVRHFGSLISIYDQTD